MDDPDHRHQRMALNLLSWLKPLDDPEISFLLDVVRVTCVDVSQSNQLSQFFANQRPSQLTQVLDRKLPFVFEIASHSVISENALIVERPKSLL
jgi:hypothetical protein